MYEDALSAVPSNKSLFVLSQRLSLRPKRPTSVDPPRCVTHACPSQPVKTPTKFRTSTRGRWDGVAVERDQETLSHSAVSCHTWLVRLLLLVLRYVSSESNMGQTDERTVCLPSTKGRLFGSFLSWTRFSFLFIWQRSSWRALQRLSLYTHPPFVSSSPVHASSGSSTCLSGLHTLGLTCAHMRPSRI